MCLLFSSRTHTHTHQHTGGQSCVFGRERRRKKGNFLSSGNLFSYFFFLRIGWQHVEHPLIFHSRKGKVFLLLLLPFSFHPAAREEPNDSAPFLYMLAFFFSFVPIFPPFLRLRNPFGLMTSFESSFTRHFSIPPFGSEVRGDGKLNKACNTHSDRIIPSSMLKGCTNALLPNGIHAEIFRIRVRAAQARHLSVLLAKLASLFLMHSEGRR